MSTLTHRYTLSLKSANLISEIRALRLGELCALFYITINKWYT